MSRFKYSDEEMDINKVLKMNQDMAFDILNNKEMKQSKNNADYNVNESIEILRELGKDKELNKLFKEISEKSYDRPLVHRPQLDTWEEIVKEANIYNPNTVILEDIMTDSEIQSCIEELDEINKKFSKKTRIINKIDLSFLAIAIALQVVKVLIFPYIASKFDYGNQFNPKDRVHHDDKIIKKEHKQVNDKFRDENIKKYGKGYWIQMLYQAVPYDIIRGSDMNGLNHRLHTLGHDPILGWIFGTTNILTDCITFNTFITNRVIRKDPITNANISPLITNQMIPISTMLQECYDMIKADRINLPTALFVQAKHFKSDEFTKMGLPVPILSTINEDFASKLYKEHYDSLCFSRDVKMAGVSFIVSKLIDIIILLIHGMFRKEIEDKELFETRTRKILLISNSIASTSTIINATLTQNPKNLDIGSLLNTITHLFSDIRFITKIKREFIENEISDRMHREVSELDEMFENI